MVQESLRQHTYPYLYHHSTPSLRHNITRYLVGECKFLYFKIVIYEQKQISTPNSFKKKKYHFLIPSVTKYFVFNSYFFLQLIKIFYHKLQEPNSHLQASPQILTYGDITGTNNQSWNGECRCKVPCKSPHYCSATFMCPLLFGFIVVRAHSIWIKITIPLQTKTNSSQRDADKNGNYGDFHKLQAHILQSHP